MSLQHDETIPTKTWLATSEEANAALAAEPHRYFTQLARDVSEACGDLAACRSPVDLFFAEQKYLLARCRSWQESSLRLLGATPGERVREQASELTEQFIMPD